MLAINADPTAITLFLEEIGDAKMFWDEQIREGAKKMDVSRLNVAGILIKKLCLAEKVNEDIERNGPLLSTSRTISKYMDAIAALSITELLRDHGLVRDDVPFYELGKNGTPNLLLDGGVLLKEHPIDGFDSRVHAAITDPLTLPQNASQWYKCEGLWIKQERPAAPTTFLRRAITPDTIRLDLTGHETLFPYLAMK